MGVTGGYWAVLQVRSDQRIRAKPQSRNPQLSPSQAENAGSNPLTRSLRPACLSRSENMTQLRCVMEASLASRPQLVAWRRRQRAADIRWKS